LLSGQCQDLIGGHPASGASSQAGDNAITTPPVRLVNAPEPDYVILHDELDFCIG
jgi:hypothetical protein